MKTQESMAKIDIFDRNGILFSDNRKISLRQIRRTLTLELFGLSSLMLPGYLAEESGILGILALAIGAGGAWLLLALWKRISENGAFGDIYQNNQNMICRCLEVLAGAGLLSISAYVLYVLTSLLQEHLLGGKYVPVILLSLTVAGIFGLAKGLEARIRVYEVLFYFLLVPLIIILILACVNVKPVYWTWTSFTVPGIAKSSFVCFMFFSLSSVILLSRTHCNHPEYAMRSARCGLMAAFALNVAVYLILLGIFQDKLLSAIPFPVILLMEVVKIPGRFFEREDTFMISIWFFCLFALFHSTLFYGKELLQKGLGKKKERQRKNQLQENPWQNRSLIKRVLLCLICGAVVFVTAAILFLIEGLAENYFEVLILGIGPILLILPILYVVCRRRL